jgi:hypothetical protein
MYSVSVPAILRSRTVPLEAVLGLGERRFVALFSVCPQTLEKLWYFLCNTTGGEGRPFRLSHLLWAVNWLSEYSPESAMAVKWGVSEKTLRQVVRKIVLFLYERLIVVSDHLPLKLVFLFFPCFSLIN